jgi:hypothetical protein
VRRSAGLDDERFDVFDLALHDVQPGVAAAASATLVVVAL